jgi:hypothetical protein
MRIELVFERNTACPSGFSMGRNAHFVSNRTFWHIVETHDISLKKKHVS